MHNDAWVLNNPPLGPYTQDEDILITDEYNPEDYSEYAVGLDEIGFYTHFLKDKADKMLILLPLFDGEKPEKAKTHYERFSQYIKFQTKEGNIKDTTKEAIELF